MPTSARRIPTAAAALAASLACAAASHATGLLLTSGQLEASRAETLVCTLINEDDEAVEADLTLKGPDGGAIASQLDATILPGESESVSFPIPFGPPVGAYCHVDVTSPAEPLVFGNLRVDGTGNETRASSQLRVHQPLGPRQRSGQLEAQRAETLVCTVINKHGAMVWADITLKDADGIALGGNGGAAIQPGETTSFSMTAPFGPALGAYCHVETSPSDATTFGNLRVNDIRGSTRSSSPLEGDPREDPEVTCDDGRDNDFDGLVDDLDPDCAALAYQHCGDGTIADLDTGLLWEDKVPGGGGCTTDLHAVDAECTWTQATGAWIDAVNAEVYAGFDDWRVPNAKELQSIVDYSTVGPSIDTAFDPTASSSYWSATPSAGNNPDNAWFVGFNGGRVDRGAKDSTRHVRAVRSGPCSTP